MAGKDRKREARRAREAARAAARRRERQRTIQTAIIVAIVVAIGGVVIFASLGDGQDELAAAESASPSPSEPDATVPPINAEACTPEPAPSASRAPVGPFVDGPEQVLEDGGDYRAVVDTTCGQIVFELFDDDAPETVNSFVFLAQEGFYDGLEIFRNSPGIAILQTGSGDNSNAYDVGYQLPDEFTRAQSEGGYAAGSLALAKSSAPNSGGSQFFMVYGDSSLPPDYTLFGRVVEGLDVLQSIGVIPTQDPADPANEVPSQVVVMERVTIEQVPEGAEPSGSAPESGTAAEAIPTES